MMLRYHCLVIKAAAADNDFIGLFLEFNCLQIIIKIFSAILKDMHLIPVVYAISMENFIHIPHYSRIKHSNMKSLVKVLESPASQPSSNR